MKRFSLSEAAVLLLAITCGAADGVKTETIESGRTWRVRMSRDGKWPSSGMERYGIFPEIKAVGEATSLPAEGIAMRGVAKGYELSFPLADGESIYGFGDIQRSKLNRRGGEYSLWVTNVVGYAPVPLAISSKGWGVLLNTSWRTTADVGKAVKDRLIFSAKEGDIDFFYFKGSPRGILDAYTKLTGRPSILPVWGYGFTYVCFDRSNEFQLLNYATEFRRNRFPCDQLGLDPGWMSRNYDFTVRKGWHPDRFYHLWEYLTRRETFIGTLDRMGMKLNLWICCDYDHFQHEEAELAGESNRKRERIVPKVSGGMTDGWVDWRTSNDPGLKQAQTKDHTTNGLSATELKGLVGKEPWFEHLKEFVGQGVQGFKLDGAKQVIDHPGRPWANGMTDEQAHNLYPLVYSKEMVRSFENYTGLRPMIYTPCGWAGFQQFSATWAGDTGGGLGPLSAMLQQGVTGHSNVSCDMVTTDIRALHFAFLSPWSLLDDWAFFFQPWCQEKEAQDVFRAYDELHYRLLPYIYTGSYHSHKTGWPLMRSLALEYPEAHPAYDDCLSAWKFGDNLLIAAFTEKLALPAGDWYEWRTCAKVTGPATVPVEISPAWGGALYVKAGSVIPMWPVKQHVEKGWNETVEFHVWPGESGASELYEDDGVSVAYREGEGAVTPLKLETEQGWFFDTRKLTIGARKGTFRGALAKRDITVVWHDEDGTTTTNLIAGADVSAATFVKRN
ncbi:MAG: glycoside hydrolase family 31 protein [Kiritimatiellae bacterium]|nr:glycoside hydrolase family 31 protein [Kiritimatiellia bacterium]